MTTWNKITIENPPADFSIDNLPDSLSADGPIWEDWNVDDERVTLPERRPILALPGYVLKERPGNPDGDVTIKGRSWRYAEEAEADLIELSRRGARITWYEEWDDDGFGRRTTVYVNGEHVKADSRHNEDVPDNLNELVNALRAQFNQNAPDPDSIGSYARLELAARALVDALRPGR